MAVSNQLTQNNGEKKLTFSQAVQLPAYQNLINSTLKDPKRANRFIASVVSAVSANPTLQKCDPASVLSSALQGEALELSPSPALGEYAMVPYGSKWNSQIGDYESYKAQFQIMTGGRLQLAYRSGQYKDLDVIEIRDGEYKGKDKRTGKPIIDFIEDDEIRESKAIVGYYAYFELLNGFFKCIYVPKAKAIAHAARFSKAFDIELYEKIQRGEQLNGWKEEKKAETPWIQHFDTMACNLALRMLLKNAPKSIEMKAAEEKEFESESEGLAQALAVEKEATDDFFDGTEESEETSETEKEPEKKPRGKKAANDSGANLNADFFDSTPQQE
jgi:recombination protein RecT